MKKIISLTLASVAVAASLNAYTMVNTGDLDDAGSVTWDTAGSPYILNGTIFVKGTDLTILPGVTVRGQGRNASGVAGAPGSLIVTQTGYVDAQGTPSQPIIFTSAVLDENQDGNPDKTDGFYDQFTGEAGADTFLDDTPRTAPLAPTSADGNATYQYWGGLVILGEAPTNLGPVGTSKSVASDPIWSGTTCLGHIEGLPKSSDTLYGGYIYNDNSGIYRYLSVRHGGDVLGSANEINGITLGGVGAGTIFEFCEVYMNEDDGFEFFGGTVNTRNLVVAYVGDDSFDGDQGWTGTNQYWLSVQSYLSAVGGDKGFEFDGDDGYDADANHAINAELIDTRINFADYTVYNATIVGPRGATGAAVDNGGVNLKSRFGGAIYSSYFVGTKAPTSGGISADVGAIIADCTFASDIVDFVADTNSFLTSTANLNASNNSVNTGSGFGANGIIGADSAYVVDSAALNPRPSFAISGVNNSVIEGTNVQTNSYRGAFDPSSDVELWTKDWTALSIAGVLVD